MTAMHVESRGRGAPLLMLHGWGMHGGMWGAAVGKLAACSLVHCVDLPGHGYSGPLRHGHSLDDLVHTLAARFDAPFALCGWSLGGLVALRWAELYPHQIEKLVLVSSTPCFMQRQGWNCAMPAGTLQVFANSLAEAWRPTLLRFLSLQVQGSDDPRAALAGLRASLLLHGEPQLEALQDGLALLRETDLRESLQHIVQPALVVAGERDTLTPFAAAKYLAQAMPNARLVGMEGAAHVPFLSHTQRFVEHIEDFLNEQASGMNGFGP